MKALGCLFLIVTSVLAASDDERDRLAPVLRSFEPPDSVVFTLPGPPPVKVPVHKVLTSPPVAIASPLPTRLQPIAIPPLPEEIGFFCQKQIGQWKQADARTVLGAPLRSRLAYDENQSASGRIFAFRDPTGLYRELELDFDGKTGALRSVFVYPPRMTWDEVRHRWSGEVTSADAPQGRKFYSYAHRHLDVLVDAQGRVISLGLY